MSKKHPRRTEELNKYFEAPLSRRNKKGESEIERFKSLKERGHTVKEISNITGFSITTIRRRLDPTMQKRYREKDREWERKNRPPGSQKGKKKNPEVDLKYKQSQRGFFINLYNTKVSSVKAKEKLKKLHENKPIITFDEFMQLWQKHVRNYGVTCYYTGVPLTFYDPDNPKAPTLCSVDRFDSDEGYTKENIVFCCWAFNNKKGNMSLKDCYIIIKKHRERMQREPERLYFSTGGIVGGL